MQIKLSMPYFSTLAKYIDYIVPEIDSHSYDTTHRYNLYNYCVHFNPYAIMNYYLYYLLGIIIFKNYIKRHILVTNIISSYVCWCCVLGSNTNNLLSYYYYDLPLLIVKKDIPLILHHIFTIFCLNFCLSDYDGVIFYKCLFLFKYSDLLLHHYKILDALEIKNKYPLTVRIYQLIINLYTFASWIILRIILPFGVYPATTVYNNILCMLFHIGNIWWTYKVYSTIKKIWVELKHMNKK
jgi:hypothetical protein